MNADRAYALVEKLLKIIDQVESRQLDDLMDDFEEMLTWLETLP